MMDVDDIDSWTWEEDVITCKFFLDHLKDWAKSSNVLKLIKKLKEFGYSREENDVRVRLSNYYSYQTNSKLSSISPQGKRVYNLLKEI